MFIFKTFYLINSSNLYHFFFIFVSFILFNLYIYFQTFFFSTNLTTFFSLTNYIIYNTFTHNTLAIIDNIYFSFQIAKSKKCLLVSLKYCNTKII